MLHNNHRGPRLAKYDRPTGMLSCYNYRFMRTHFSTLIHEIIMTSQLKFYIPEAMLFIIENIKHMLC